MKKKQDNPLIFGGLFFSANAEQIKIKIKSEIFLNCKFN